MFEGMETKKMEMLSYKLTQNTLDIVLSGNYVLQNLPDSLPEMFLQNKISEIHIDGAFLKTWDSSLLVALTYFKEIAKKQNLHITFANLPTGVQKLLELSEASAPHLRHSIAPRADFLTRFGDFGVDIFRRIIKGTRFTFDNLKTFFCSFFKTMSTRRVDFLFALDTCGPSALPIVLLISFMVGLILAFVGAVQLQTFGAQVYVASLVTIGMTRIMGAIMVGIIMAGRTGASFAATIGTMQVNEEIDALRTMGIPVNQFLVLPRLKALVLTMPILTMLADFAGIFGGAFVAVLALDIPLSEFIRYAVNAWKLKHFFVGIFHALVFGFIIALSGCYFGIECSRSADSVGKSTTNAVVYGIVWMIVATGLITLVLQRLGI